jgi:protein dithiol oxidoreductase (disulfide-forming)
MSNWLKKIGLLLFTAFAVLSLTAAHAQKVFQLNPPQPVENDGKVEVLEFFAYGCIHCANLEPSFEAWLKRQPADVKVKRIPSPVPIMGIDSTVMYYSLEALGQLDRLHAKIFTAAHLEKVVLGNPALLNKWLEKNGVDPAKYEEVQKSFSVVTKVNRARKMVAEYRIEATPTIVVNGKFAAEQGNGSAEAMFASIDQVISQARALNKAASDLAKEPAPAKAVAKPAVKKVAPAEAK